MVEECREVSGRKTKMGSGECLCLTIETEHAVEEKLGAVECWSGNVQVQVQVQSNSCKKCVLETVSDLNLMCG